MLRYVSYQANERRFSDGIEIDYRSVRSANLGDRLIASRVTYVVYVKNRDI